ncbi:hypothetical protein DZG03_17475, partial [Clavibacter phaseoli]
DIDAIYDGTELYVGGVVGGGGGRAPGGGRGGIRTGGRQGARARDDPLGPDDTRRWPGAIPATASSCVASRRCAGQKSTGVPSAARTRSA